MQVPSGWGGTACMVFCTAPAASGPWAAWEGRKATPAGTEAMPAAREGRPILAKIFVHRASSVDIKLEDLMLAFL